MRLIAALLLLSSTLFSHDIPSGIEGACLQGEPSSFIEGCVSAITGELFFFQDDLVVRGASPLTIRRRYTGLETQNPKLAWHLFHHTLATVVVSPVTTKIYVNEPNGTSMFYFGENTLERKKQNLILPDKFQTVHESFAKGRTNTGQDFLGGQYHPKSNKIELRDVNTFKIVLSNGGSRTYEMIEGKTFFNAQQNRTIYSHQLKEERLANGHVLCFQYDEENRLKGVILKNPSKTKIFASYLAKRIDDEKNKAFRVEVTSSDKRKVIYHYQYLENNEVSPPLRPGEYLQRIEDGAFPNESFQYSNRFRKIKRRTLKDNRSIHFDLNPCLLPNL